MCSNDHDPLEQLQHALRALASTVAVERGSVGSSQRISRLLDARAVLDAALVDEVAAFDAAGAYADEGNPTAASWLRAANRLTRRDASAMVHFAREMRELPVTFESLRSGAISREHAVQIVKAKTTLGMEAGEFERYEQTLVDLATEARRMRSRRRPATSSRWRRRSATSSWLMHLQTAASTCARSATSSRLTR